MLLLTLVLLASFSFVLSCPPIIGNCYTFPPDDEINRPIDTDPVDYMSDCTVNTVVTWNTGNLRLDLGDNVNEGYGIPYTVTNGVSLKPITYGVDGENYQSESDWYSSTGVFYTGNSATPYVPAYLPWPQQTSIEGWRGTPSTDPTGGDRHVLVVDQRTCMLYEAWNSVRLSHGFQVSNTAIFNMSRKLPQRPDYWTSGDAAGLPIFPVLLKYQEIAAGVINHAIRFTALRAQNAFTYPGTHCGPSGNNNPYYPAYGSRFRLKSNFDISSYSNESQVLLTALKKYGLIFADQGSTAYISGVSDPGFTNMLSEINSAKKISFTNLEMVQSPYQIMRCYTPHNLTCGTRTNNSEPFVPSFVPNCPSTFTPVYYPAMGDLPSSATKHVLCLIIISLILIVH